MKENRKRSRWGRLAGMICLLLFVNLLGPVETGAADSYTKVKIDHSTVVKGSKCTIKVLNYYQRVVLKGDTEGIKAINKRLKAISKKYMSHESQILGMAKVNADEFTYDETYLDYVTQKLTYLSDSVVCIRAHQIWYAGGVQNDLFTGYTFQLKNGKEIKKITSVTKTKSLSKLREELKKKILAADDQLDAKEVARVLAGKKETEFLFYLTGKGNVAVCFDPYELGYGGWARTVVVPGCYASH